MQFRNLQFDKMSNKSLPAVLVAAVVFYLLVLSASAKSTETDKPQKSETCTSTATGEPSTADASVAFKSAVPEEKKPIAELVHAGDSLPINAVETIDGNNIDFRDPGKRKLIVLFATWCSDSLRAMTALNQSSLLKDPSVEIIAIGRKEDKQTLQKWREQTGFEIPLAADPDGAIYYRFAEGGIPRFVTVDQQGKVIKMNLAEGAQQLSQIQW